MSASPDVPGGERDRDRAVPGAGARDKLALAFLGLVAATFCLIVLGALVRAHDAGLACPDWPLCFGDVIPRMNLEVGFEWTHRLVAGSVAVGFAALAWSALRRPDRPRVVGPLLALAAALLALQIALGAFTVWLKLASWTVTAHLLTGNAFALTCFSIALALRDAHAGRSAPRASAGARAGLAAVALLLLAQIALGGLVASRYAGMACPEWPTCNGGVYFPSWAGAVGLHLMHRTNGYLLVAALAAVAWVCRGEAALRSPTALAFGLGAAQVVVGIANVRTGIPVEITGLHSALAAALVLTVTYAVREAGFRAPAVRT